ncbi:MAG: acyl-CoA/acyl-ACP dehydrogenase [Rhodospirillaceae bacterium]|nr:acyl-CoA/acyl-ACP dehydrogenase [Rhodospirillaceae bacterium]
MDFDLPEETRMLQGTVRKFVEKELFPLETSLPDRPNSHELPADVKAILMEKVRALGLWAMEAPEEIGGGGLGLLDHCIVTEEAYRCTAGRSLWSSLFFPVLNTLGTPEQKEKYLIPGIKGEFHGASAFSEPNAAGDLAGIQTSAEKVDGGWKLNGTKCWISHAKSAKFVLVLTRLKGTSRHEGMTWFIVDAGTDGFSVGREQRMIHGQSTYELFLNDCVVTESQLLGEPGQGWGAGESALYRGRVMISARAIGIAQRCYEMMIDYAKIRHTFGKPLSSRQAIQWMIADSATDLHASRLMVYEAAWRAQQGQEVRTQMAMIKAFTSEMAGRVVDRAVQIHGAAGLSDETILERCYRDVRPMRIYEGSSEAMRSVIARNELQSGRNR